MAPDTTSGSGRSQYRSSRYAVSSMVSVPCTTTTPSAPASVTWPRAHSATATTSVGVSQAPGIGPQRGDAQLGDLVEPRNGRHEVGRLQRRRDGTPAGGRRHRDRAAQRRDGHPRPASPLQPPALPPVRPPAGPAGSPPYDPPGRRPEEHPPMTDLDLLIAGGTVVTSTGRRRLHVGVRDGHRRLRGPGDADCRPHRRRVRAVRAARRGRHARAPDGPGQPGTRGLPDRHVGRGRVGSDDDRRAQPRHPGPDGRRPAREDGVPARPVQRRLRAGRARVARRRRRGAPHCGPPASPSSRSSPAPRTGCRATTRPASPST